MSPRLTSSSTSAPAVAAGGHQPLEDGDAPAAEALVEGRLRLDDRHPRGQRLGRGEREPLQPGDVVGEAPVGQQRGVRVDPGAQRAALRDGGVQPGAEAAVIVVTPVASGARRRDPARPPGPP